jgi:hypothetical protein
MTPTEMLRVLTRNIETARAAMEDGATGYVLHTADHVHFLCQRGNDSTVRLGDPLDDDIAVLTSHARAVTMQRYWNSQLKDGSTFNKVVVSLRREALVGYIDVQRRTLNVLTEMGASR